jgi:hypothetical protein
VLAVPSSPIIMLAAFNITLMTDAASTSEMLVNFYQTTQRNNPADSHLHTRHNKNIKSHLHECWCTTRNMQVNRVRVSFSLRKTNSVWC